MPITFEEAKSIALSITPAGAVIIETIEKPYGWYFNYQSEEFVKTRDYRYMLVGGGGFIVEKGKGQIFRFGSAFPLEENFRRYELGFRYENDLLISEVIDLSVAVECLHRLFMKHTIPARQGSTTQSIEEFYSKQEIYEKLKHLPCYFIKQRFYLQVELLEKMQAANCLVFSILEHDPTRGN